MIGEHNTEIIYEENSEGEIVGNGCYRNLNRFERSEEKFVESVTRDIKISVLCLICQSSVFVLRVFFWDKDDVADRGGQTELNGFWETVKSDDGKHRKTESFNLCENF
jgi:hypothetical protein